MSLFSYLKADTLGSSAMSAQVAQAMQAIAETKGASVTGDARSAGNGSSVSITVQARRVAAEKEDANQAAPALAAALRGALDAAYASVGERHSADLTVLSGRALAVMVLNESGQFSRAEVAAAKGELRGRDRQAVLTQISADGLTASSLAAYLKQSLGARAAMSAEERGLRDANPNLR